MTFRRLFIKQSSSTEQSRILLRLILQSSAYVSWLGIYKHISATDTSTGKIYINKLATDTGFVVIGSEAVISNGNLFAISSVGATIASCEVAFGIDCTSI